MNKAIKRISTINFHGNVYGLSRSFLAFGSLSTLIFNDNSELFPLLKDTMDLTSGNSVYDYTTMDKFSIFNLFSEHLILAKLISLAILLLVIIGWRPKYTGLFHWWISMSIFLSIQIPDGGDQITANISLLLIPLILTDNRKWHWNYPAKVINKPYRNLILFSTLIMIKLQMSFLYFQATVDKLAVLEWKKGTVLYYWFTHHIFGLNDFLKPIFMPLLENTFSVALLTWSVLILEFLLCASIISTQKIKYRLFIVGILFHFAIFLIHGLFSFFIAMTAGLLLYLIPIDINIKKNQFINSLRNFNLPFSVRERVRKMIS